MSIRLKVWMYLTRKLPVGEYLPTWALVVHAVFWPLDALSWHLGASRGYQVREDIWLINGVRWDAAALRMMAESEGQALLPMKNRSICCYCKATNLKWEQSGTGWRQGKRRAATELKGSDEDGTTASV